MRSLSTAGCACAAMPESDRGVPVPDPTPTPQDEIARAIFNGVHRVIRISVLPTHDEFFATRVKDTLALAQGPDLAPDFWWEAVVVEVQNGAMIRDGYIKKWNVAALRAREGQTWGAVHTYVTRNVGPRR